MMNFFVANCYIPFNGKKWTVLQECVCFAQKLFCLCWMNNVQYFQFIFSSLYLKQKKLLSVMLKPHSLAFHNFCVKPVLVRLVYEDTCSSRVNGISFIEIDSCLCMCTLLVLLWTGGCCHAIWVPCSARWADIQQPVRRHWQIRDWTGPQGVSVHRSAVIALRKPIKITDINSECFSPNTWVFISAV